MTAEGKCTCLHFIWLRKRMMSRLLHCFCRMRRTCQNIRLIRCSEGFVFTALKHTGLVVILWDRYYLGFSWLILLVGEKYCVLLFSLPQPHFGATYIHFIAVTNVTISLFIVLRLYFTAFIRQTF